MDAVASLSQALCVFCCPLFPSACVPSEIVPCQLFLLFTLPSFPFVGLIQTPSLLHRLLLLIWSKPRALTLGNRARQSPMHVPHLVKDCCQACESSGFIKIRGHPC